MILPATKLNSTIKTISQKRGKPFFDVDFWSGEFLTALPKMTNKLIPSSKVAVLFSKATYQTHAKQLTEKFKQNGNSIISVVMPDDFEDSLANYSEIFNLAEDVRLIVTLDEKFYSISKYFATIRQIDCLLVVRNLNCYGILAPEITIKKDECLEEVKISARGHILFDYNDIKKSTNSLANAYAFIVSHTLALVDYRINAFLTGVEVEKNAYYLASQAIINTYSIFSLKKEEFFNLLVENFFNIELANLFSYNNFYKSFSSRFVAKQGDFNDYSASLLKTSTLIAKIYNLLCSDKYDKLLEYPDYLSRADFISKRLNLSHACVNSIIVKNCKTIESKYAKGVQFLKNAQKDVNSFVNCSNTMLNTFTVLGGNVSQSQEDFGQLIKHSGDLTLNGMTLVRESGITELM